MKMKGISTAVVLAASLRGSYGFAPSTSRGINNNIKTTTDVVWLPFFPATTHPAGSLSSESERHDHAIDKQRTSCRTSNHVPRTYATHHKMQLFSSAIAAVTGSLRMSSPIVKFSLLLTMALTLILKSKGRTLLYPNTQADPAFQEPLPPGSLGCPFAGRLDVFTGSKDYGAGAFYLKMAKKMKNNAKMWKYYFLGRPLVTLAGLDNIKYVLNQEFEPDGISTISTITESADPNERANKKVKDTIMGQQSLTTESNKERHSQLRRLVGQAITPGAVTKSIPSLQAAAEEQVQSLLEQSASATAPVKMEDVCTDFTLDVAWRQILGLNLKGDEVPTFHQVVNDWISGVVSIQSMVGIGVKYTKGYKARMYLEDLLEKRIDDLLANGPDTSTLSGMVFASDDDGTGKVKLSRREIIDNAMLLILAGSETSASTLANAMLFLGLNRDKWQKLVQEQKELQAKYGSEITKEMIDKESPYLEAVVKESMRIRPISGGIPRRTKSTMIIDGKQIPKNWILDWNVVLTHQYDPKTYKEDNSHMDVMKGFQPERWLNDDTMPAEFLPMGAGPRYCLGANLAYAEMKVFLAVMARNLNFTLARNPDDKVRWKRMSIIPKEENGVPVHIQESAPLSQEPIVAAAAL